MRFEHELGALFGIDEWVAIEGGDVGPHACCEFPNFIFTSCGSGGPGRVGANRIGGGNALARKPSTLRLVRFRVLPGDGCINARPRIHVYDGRIGAERERCAFVQKRREWPHHLAAFIAQISLRAAWVERDVRRLNRRNNPRLRKPRDVGFFHVL